MLYKAGNLSVLFIKWCISVLKLARPWDKSRTPMSPSPEKNPKESTNPNKSRSIQTQNRHSSLSMLARWLRPWHARPVRAGVSARGIYVAARKKPRQAQAPPVSAWQKPQYDRERRELDALEQRVKQVEAYKTALKHYVEEQESLRAKAAQAAKEGVKTDRHAADDEVELLGELLDRDEKVHSGLDLFSLDVPELPPAIAARLDGKTTNQLAVAVRNRADWGAVVAALEHSDQHLEGLQTADANALLAAIPLDQRASLLAPIRAMMDAAAIQPTRETYDLAMAGLAHQGDVPAVENLLTQLRADGITPSVYTYGHVVRAYARTGAMSKIAATLELMKSEGIEPSLPIYTNVMQTCVKLGEYDQAFRVFDMLKFLSLKTQPDVDVYNTLMLAAARQYNVDRVLDLLREMTTRPVDPLAPNERTYNILIYACARDPRTHLQAWRYLVDMHAKGFAVDRRTMNALLYLCGNSGETMLARAIFKQMCRNPASYPDAYAFTCLLNAYRTYKPGFFSPVLTSDMGSRIRSSFFFEGDVGGAAGEAEAPDGLPPFLPLQLTSKEQAMAESAALYKFFKDTRPHMINDRVLMAYLRVPLELGDFREFVRRYEASTFFEPPADNTDGLSDDASSRIVEEDHSQTQLAKSQPNGPVALPSHTRFARNHHTYTLAIRACIMGKNLDYGARVWSERGAYRRTASFRAMSQEDRRKSDYLFARDMVHLHAVCGQVSEALSIIESSKKLFIWKKHHIQEFIAVLEQHEDHRTLAKVKRILSAYYANETARRDEYARYVYRHQS